MKVTQTLRKEEMQRLAALCPSARAATVELVARCNARGLHLRVGETYRPQEEQAARVAKGQSATLRSWHFLRRALHLYPLYGEGNRIADVTGKRKDLYAILHEEAKAQGFKAAGGTTDWWRVLKGKHGPFVDQAHFEWREGMTYAQARAAMQAVA